MRERRSKTELQASSSRFPIWGFSPKTSLLRLRSTILSPIKSQANSVAALQLAQHVRKMRLHRVLTNAKCSSNFVIAHACGNQPSDIDFALAERARFFLLAADDREQFNDRLHDRIACKLFGQEGVRAIPKGTCLRRTAVTCHGDHFRTRA